ncbi:MAG: hypothetical protein IPK68_09665 [Bdellovibrionales bacterium]|nr:hypothetical protein [Bdellovibrionales bacterium]
MAQDQEIAWHKSRKFDTKKPEIEKIKAAAKQLFPHRYQQLMPKSGKDDYQIARSFLTNLAVERHHQLTAGQWSEAKQKHWIEMPYLPMVMREVDDEFVNWCFPRCWA